MKEGEKMSDELRQKLSSLALLRVTPEFRQKMREIGLQRVRKSRCKWGHDLTPENTYADKHGYKTCRRCMTRHEVKTRAALYHRTIKVEVLSHYSPEGILKCSHTECIVSDPDMLTLDHINNDGAEFRKSQKITAGGGTYAYVKKQGYPLGYQTLCWNHQWKKQLTNLRINGKNRKKA